MIIPALDLMNGHVVRLYQGDYQQSSYYPCDPSQQLLSYQQQGAQQFHLVDLTGAKNPLNRQLKQLSQLIGSVDTPIQVGGGIRHLNEIQTLFDHGVHRVVIGSVAVTDPSLVKHWFQRFGGERLILALDIYINDQGQRLVAINGWQKGSGKTIEQVIANYQSSPLQRILCTDISRDGTLTGPNIDLYYSLCLDYPHIAFQASGGIAQLTDISLLRASGVESVIVGRALLEQKFTVTEANKCWQNG